MSESHQARSSDLPKRRLSPSSLSSEYPLTKRVAHDEGPLALASADSLKSSVNSIDLNDDPDSDEAIPRPKLDKGKGRATQSRLVELPDEIWIQIFDFYYEDCRDEWHERGKLRNAMRPLTISREHSRRAHIALYSHPILDTHTIPSFMKCLHESSAIVDVPPKAFLVRHLTIRPSPKLLLPEASESPYIHSLLPELLGSFGHLASFTLKEALILDSRDASILIEALRFIKPKKVQLEIGMWNLSDSPFANILMAASGRNLHHHALSFAAPTPQPDPTATARGRTWRPTMFGLDGGRNVVQEAWRDAITHGTELEIPPWWTEPLMPPQPPPAGIAPRRDPTRPPRHPPAFQDNSSQDIITASPRGPFGASASISPFGQTRNSRRMVPTRSASRPQSSSLIPGGVLSNADHAGLLSTLVNSEWSPPVRYSTQSHPVASLEQSEINDSSSARVTPDNEDQPGPSHQILRDAIAHAERASRFARAATDRRSLSTSVGSVRSFSHRRLFLADDSVHPDTWRAKVPILAASRNRRASSIRMSTPSPVHSDNEGMSPIGDVIDDGATTTGSIDDDEMEDLRTAMIVSDMEARNASTLGEGSSDSTVPAPQPARPLGSNPIPPIYDGLDDLTGPGIRHGLVGFELAHDFRRDLLRLLCNDWCPTLEAFSFVASDPLSSLIVRSPDLSFWPNVAVPHIRVHLPRTINSLAVFKSFREEKRDRQRRRNRERASNAGVMDVDVTVQGQGDQARSNTPGTIPRPFPQLGRPEYNDDEAERIVGGDAHGEGLLHANVKLFEIEVNTMEEMMDDVWIRCGDQIPSQVCRILVGDFDWRDVRIGAVHAASQISSPPRPMSSEPIFDSPTYSFASLDFDDDTISEVSMDPSIENSTYDEAAARAQAARMTQRKANV